MKRFLAGEMLARAGARLGITVELEPEFRYVGRIVLPDGRKHYFRNTNFDLNGQGAVEIARDKAYAAFFLARMGYPVPEGRTFFAPAMQRWSGATRGLADAYAYARDLGFPVMVKPNSASQGRGVARVHTRRELERALRAVFARDSVALVQRLIPGADYRIVVLDDQVICAYRRAPLAVTGDGAATIRDLLLRKHAAYIASGRDTTIPLDDFRIPMRLHRLGLTLDSVPAAGAKVVLMDNANLSTGGEAVDVSATLHPSYRQMAVALTRDLGLRHTGVDILTAAPIDAPLGAYTVLEVNTAPGLDHYAQIGPAQMAVVEAMYAQILQAIVALPLPAARPPGTAYLDKGQTQAYNEYD
jgi:D-alanine-D-alanine ligase-like ATP-grasp enzyme